MPKVSQEHLDARREEILDAARRCFSRYGFRGATVARLEEETGLSRGAIFNYFGSKWDIFFAVSERDNRQAIQLAVEQGFDAVVRWVAGADPDWLGLYAETFHHVRTNPKLRQRVVKRDPDQERFLQWVADQQAAGALRSDVSALDLGRFMTLVLDGLVLRASFGLPYEIEELLKLLHGGIDAA